MAAPVMATSAAPDSNPEKSSMGNDRCEVSDAQRRARQFERASLRRHAGSLPRAATTRNLNREFVLNGNANSNANPLIELQRVADRGHARLRADFVGFAAGRARYADAADQR